MVVMSDIAYSSAYDNEPCLQGCTAARRIGLLRGKDKCFRPHAHGTEEGMAEGIADSTEEGTEEGVTAKGKCGHTSA